MPEMNFSIPHFITKEEALPRIKRLIGDLRIRYSEQIGDAHETWTSTRAHFDLTVQGVTITGTLAVDDAEVRITVEYPAALAPFSDRIERYIRDEAEALLQ